MQVSLFWRWEQLFSYNVNIICHFLKHNWSVSILCRMKYLLHVTACYVVYIANVACGIIILFLC